MHNEDDSEDDEYRDYSEEDSNGSLASGHLGSSHEAVDDSRDTTDIKKEQEQTQEPDSADEVEMDHDSKGVKSENAFVAGANEGESDENIVVVEEVPSIESQQYKISFIIGDHKWRVNMACIQESVRASF